jgi:hypothetical protein
MRGPTLVERSSCDASSIAVSEYDDATLERLAEELTRQLEQQEEEPMKLIEAKAVERD